MPSVDDEIRRGYDILKGYLVLAEYMYSPPPGHPTEWAAMRDARAVVERHVRMEREVSATLKEQQIHRPDSSWEFAVHLLMAFEDWVENVTPDPQYAPYDQVQMRIATWERRLEELRDEDSVDD